MIETQEKTIGEWDYRVEQLPFQKGHRLLVRLSQILGPSFASILEGMDGEKATVSIGDLRMSAIASAVRMFVANLDEDDLERLSNTFGEYTHFCKGDGKWIKLSKDQMTVHFAGAYDVFFKWLAFCLEVNYSSFLPESVNIQDMLGAISAPGLSPSKSPNA